MVVSIGGLTGGHGRSSTTGSGGVTGKFFLQSSIWHIVVTFARVCRVGVLVVCSSRFGSAAAVRVKADETVAHFDLMNASGVGLLIQAVVGSFGGAGFWCRNRAGLAV